MRNFSVFFKLIFTVIILLSFNSCEWDGSDDNNYVEIDKPSETINIMVDLSGANPNEVIQIMNGSYVRYSLSSEGKELINQKFYLDGKELTNTGYNNEVFINEPIIDDKIHDLKLVMTYKTGTGSLADRLGVEYYIGEYNFRIKLYDRNYNPQLNIKQALSNGKYLKLEWDKPVNLDIARYEVYKGWMNTENPLAIISDANQTNFVDENYAYGYDYYTIKAIPANSINIPIIEESISIEFEPFTEDNIKASIADKIFIEWKNPNPYPAKSVVYLSDDNFKEVKDGENSVEFPRPYFPYSNNPRIYILPLNAKTEDYKLYPYTSFYVSDKKLLRYYFELQFWNKKTNSIEGIDGYECLSYDLFNNLAISNTSRLPDNMYYYFDWSDQHSLAPNGLIAIIGDQFGLGNISVFRGEDFPKHIYTIEKIGPRCMAISNNYLFYLDHKSNFYVKDLVTKETTDEIIINHETSYNTRLDVSSDGRYIILYTPSLTEPNSWYTIYELKDKKLQEIKHVVKKVDLMLFNPQDPSQIIMHDKSDQFKIIDFVSGSISKSMTNNRYLYTDPYTNNVLCYYWNKIDEKVYLAVYDKTLTNLLYKVEANIRPPKKGRIVFANNIITLSQDWVGSYALDLSESLKNK